MFERRVKDHNYGALIQLLRDSAGFPMTSVRIEDLRSRFPPNLEGLNSVLRKRSGFCERSPATRRCREHHHGAVLMCKISGRTAYFEADSLAAAANGHVHVVEVKSFPYTDGRSDPDKLGAACDQAAWYALLCRHGLIEEGLAPDVVSSDGFIIVATGLGLAPTMLLQSLDARIRRAERLLASTPNPDALLSQLPMDLQFPAADTDPEQRVELLEDVLDAVGTNYKPSCMQDCGMARLCRSRAHEASAISMCGSNVARQLPGVASLPGRSNCPRGPPHRWSGTLRSVLPRRQRRTAGFSRKVRYDVSGAARSSSSQGGTGTALGAVPPPSAG